MDQTADAPRSAPLPSGSYYDPESDIAPRKIKVMLGCLIGTLLGSHFLTISAVSIVMGPLTHDLGWNRGQISGAISLLLFIGAMMTAVWGRLIDRHGVRKIVIGGTFGVGLATGALAFSTSSLVQYYLCFAALGLLGSTAIGYSKVVGVLFSRNRGKALAIFGMESSLVGAVSPQIIFELEKHFGWRGMFIGLGLIIVCVAVALIFLLDEIGVTGASGAAKKPRVDGFEGMTIGQVRRSPTFWLINVATMAGNITTTGLLPHLVPLVESRGMSAQTAVTTLTVHTVAIPVGQFVGGFCLDRTSSARVAAPFALIAFIGLVTMAVAARGSSGASLMWLGAALLGFGNGAKRSMGTYFFTRYFGLSALAEVSGWSIAITSVFLAPMPLLFGVLYDHTKSYDAPLWILGVGLAAATLLYLGLGPYRYARDIALLPLEPDPPPGPR